MMMMTMTTTSIPDNSLFTSSEKQYGILDGFAHFFLRKLWHIDFFDDLGAREGGGDKRVHKVKWDEDEDEDEKLSTCMCAAGLPCPAMQEIP